MAEEIKLIRFGSNTQEEIKNRVREMELGEANYNKTLKRWKIGDGESLYEDTPFMATLDDVERAAAYIATGLTVLAAYDNKPTFDLAGPLSAVEGKLAVGDKVKIAGKIAKIIQIAEQTDAPKGEEPLVYVTLDKAVLVAADAGAGIGKAEAMVPEVPMAIVPEGGFTDDNPPDASDNESIVTPHYLDEMYKYHTSPKPFRPGDVIGVVDTGHRTVDGAVLAWIDGNFNVIDDLAPDFFDEHPMFNFEDRRVGGNYFRSIPRAWWKRGRVPDGKPNSGNWYMLLAPDDRAENEGFLSNGTVFRKPTGWVSEFLWGTYRAFNDGGRPGSQPNKTAWGVPFNEFKAAAANMGDGHHMTTLQEYHEILARAVIEKKTFQLWPEEARRSYAANIYRGIEEIAYDSGTEYSEGRDGIRTDASGNFEVLKDDGSGTYVATGVRGGHQIMISALLEGGLFDFMFLAANVTSSEYMIPDYFYSRASQNICFSSFFAGLVSGGVFCSYWDNADSSVRYRISKL